MPKKKEVTLSHPDKVLFPKDDITKEDLADYYHSVASAMLPYVKHRPVVLVRCPAGIETTCFFQKHPGNSIPDLPRLAIKEKGGKTEYGVVETEEDLIRLVQANVLEIHHWNCLVDKIENPDQFVLDLDPSEELEFSDSIDAAKIVKGFLEELGLKSFARLTGGKGIHLVVPIRRDYSWDEVKEFSHQAALTLESSMPETFVSSSRKAARKGKIFVDYLRNGRGATAIANFSTRARPGATVATPIAWKELKSSLNPKTFNIETTAKRLKRLKQDPWTGFSKLQQVLPSIG